jgi:hypothetical protein
MVSRGTCGADSNSNFSRTVAYHSIDNGETSYEGLNMSSVNRCVSWVPPTETPLVTFRINQDNGSTILATMPLRTTSIMMMMKPYTIIYDAAMATSRKGQLSPGQTAGIGVGVAVAVIAALVAAIMILRWCRSKSRKSKAVEEHEKGDLERVVGHLEAPDSGILEVDVTQPNIHEFQVDADTPLSELEGSHHASVELSVESDCGKQAIKS